MIPKRIKELRYEIDRLQAELAAVRKHCWRKPEHGPCCTCQRCGKDYDSCRCDLDEVADELAKARAEIQRLRKLARALSEYVPQRDITRETAQLGEIGPIEEDKA